MDNAPPVLWQLHFSHSNEKARWALDYKRVAYEPRSVLPGMHVVRAKRLYGGETLPVLILEGETIPDSARIIAALERLRPEPALYPSDAGQRERALALERDFDDVLGDHVRRWLFQEMFTDSGVSARALTTGHGTFARLAYRALFPLLRPVIKGGLGINAESAERGRQCILDGLDRIESELQPSGYLVGDRFSVADLTAAARLAPLVRPPEFPYPLPERLTDGVESFRDSVGVRPAFTWAQAMYRRHRRPARGP
jgi:glutathione S-transferase